MIRGAIFDVDGTILDSMRIWDEVGARYLRSVGKTAEPDLEEKIFFMSLPEGAEYMRKHYGLDRECHEIIEGVLSQVEEFYYHEATLKEGAKEMLKQLYERKIPMITATSSRREHIEKAFERLGIKDFFLQVFTCEEAGAGKSKPDIFHMAAEKLGTIPEETYVFEDGLYAIETASKAGFKTVGIYDDVSCNDWERIKSTADFYMRELKEFHKFWEYV